MGKKVLGIQEMNTNVHAEYHYQDGVGGMDFYSLIGNGGIIYHSILKPLFFCIYMCVEGLFSVILFGVNGNNHFLILTLATGFVFLELVFIFEMHK